MTKINKAIKFQIEIRPLELSDSGNVYKLVKQREVSKWTEQIPYPYPKNGGVEFIKLSQKAFKAGTMCNFAIVLKETNQLIGIIGFADVDKKNKNAELGYWLGKPYWGQGVMSEAVNLALAYAFNELKLHSVHAKVYEPNIASQKVLLKAGFRQEGIFVEHKYRFGKWHNLIRFGILQKEFKKKTA